MQIDKPQPEKFVLCQKCYSRVIKPGERCFCQTVNNRNK